MQSTEKVIDTLLETGAHRATKYISEHEVITATRKMFRKKFPRKGDNTDIALKIGRPNFRERLFIKSAKRAGEMFPVKKIQLQFPPKPRA